MPVDYAQAIIITGGKLIRNESSNMNNNISFQQIKDGGKTYLEVIIKTRIPEVEIINTVRTLESFKDEDEIINSKNLVVLGTKKTIQDGLTKYILNTEDVIIDVNFDKNNTGQIGVQITASDISKTDRGGDSSKTDRSYIPF